MSDASPPPFADDAPEDQADPPGRGRWSCCGTLVVFGLLLLVLAGLGKGHSQVSRARVKGALASLDAEGLGLEGLFPDAPEPNGATLLQPALEIVAELDDRPEAMTLGPSVGFLTALKHPTSEDAELYEPNPKEEGGPQTVADAVVLICATVDSVDSHVDAALEVPVWVFPVDWSQGFSVDLPHLMPLKTLINAYGTRAIRRQLDGNAQGAWEDALRMARVIAHYDEPTLISRLVRLALVGITTATIEALLQAGPPPDPSMLTRLDDALGDLEDHRGFTSAMRGELAFCMTLADEAPDVGWSAVLGTDVWVARVPIISEGVFLHWTADWIDVQAELVRASTLEPHKTLAELEAIMKRAEQGSLLVQLMTPALAKAYRKLLSARANLRMARLALRLPGEGSLPETLSAPGLVDPLDPGLGPLRWRRAGPRRGELWSVGNDMQDDGGRFWDSETSSGSASDPGWDQPFRIKLPN